MTKHQQQANNGVHEDQLVKIIVKKLDEEVTLNLDNNAEVNTEDIMRSSSA